MYTNLITSKLLLSPEYWNASCRHNSSFDVSADRDTAIVISLKKNSVYDSDEDDSSDSSSSDDSFDSSLLLLSNNSVICTSLITPNCNKLPLLKLIAFAKST